MDQIEKTGKVVTLCDFRAIKRLDSRSALLRSGSTVQSWRLRAFFSAKEVVSLMKRFLDKLSLDG